ncbi:hypothetical protein ACFLSF_02085 [Candidatus Bipolaricaulota bacterium]
MRNRAVAIALIAIVCWVPLAAIGQQVDSGFSQGAQTVQEVTQTAANQALTYIDSVANYFGQGVLYVLNLITNDRVSVDLKKPIGYLALITLILLVFGLIDFARKIIWIGIIVGWVLLIVRVILDALNI